MNHYEENDHTPEENEARRQKIVAMAQELDIIREGELEVDDNAKTSEGGDNGCYVQAWVWVSFGGTDLDKETEE